MFRSSRSTLWQTTPTTCPSFRSRSIISKLLSTWLLRALDIDELLDYPPSLTRGVVADLTKLCRNGEVAVCLFLARHTRVCEVGSRLRSRCNDISETTF